MFSAAVSLSRFVAGYFAGFYFYYWGKCCDVGARN